MYSLFDVEEDEEMIIYPGKSYGSSTAVFTYTDSTALHSTSTYDFLDIPYLVILLLITIFILFY